MKALKDFTCKVTGKRFMAGDNYTGDRVKELTAKGLLGEGDTELVTVFTLPDDKEKVEAKPTPKNVVATMSTQKVNRKK